MKRMAFWGLSLLLIGALAIPGLAQAAQDQPKWKDNKEYDDYLAVYNEKDFPKKAAGAEKFFVDHKDADPIALTNMYQMMLLAYANAGNWPKTLETVERPNLGPKLTDADKAKNTQIGLLAAVNSMNNAKTIEYGEKVLATDPTNLNALIGMSSALSQTLPATDPAKSTQITKTLEITKRALALPRPQGVQDAQWNPIQVRLHQTSCLMLLNQTKYTDSIAECQSALKINGKDSYAWYLIGMSHKAELADRIKKYNEALEKYNANRSADQITVDDLKATYQGLEKVASDKKDETVDAFARSAAAGGDAATQAREELRKLMQGSTAEEINRLIEEKKGQLGN